jgi:ethanolamine utilization protein EutQ
VPAGRLVVDHADGRSEVRAGQAVHARPGEWVRYGSPEPEGADYISVWIPAFSPGTVHRD